MDNMEIFENTKSKVQYLINGGFEAGSGIGQAEMCVLKVLCEQLELRDRKIEELEKKLAEMCVEK